MNNKQYVFLLEPIHNATLCKKKLILAENEQSAREHALRQTPPERPEGELAELLDPSIYENSSQVSCRQLIEGEDYSVKHSYSDNGVDIMLFDNNKKYCLRDEHSEDVE